MLHLLIVLGLESIFIPLINTLDICVCGKGNAYEIKDIRGSYSSECHFGKYRKAEIIPNSNYTVKWA